MMNLDASYLMIKAMKASFVHYLVSFYDEYKKIYKILKIICANRIKDNEIELKNILRQLRNLGV